MPCVCSVIGSVKKNHDSDENVNNVYIFYYFCFVFNVRVMYIAFMIFSHRTVYHLIKMSLFTASLQRKY